MNVNRVIIAGNLTRDPEVRFTTKGQAVATFSVAVNRKFTVDGEQREEVTFVDVQAWGKHAETLGKHLTKGRPIYIEGRLKFEQWDDKKTGEKRSAHRVVVESFQFVGPKPEGAAQRSEAAPAAPAAATSNPPPEDDDVPF